MERDGENNSDYVWNLADRVIVLEKGVLKKEIQKEEMNRFTEEDTPHLGLRSLQRVSPVSLVKNTEQAETDDVILLKNFHYSYDKKQEIFNIPSIQIAKEKVTAIVGKNGAGKTTFLKVLSGIRKNNGIMVLDGKSYSSKKRLGKIFMVMQDVNHQLFTESVLDEVLISQPEENEEEAKRILAKVGLLSFADRHPMSLSGGQKQRVALACAIASKLPVLLLDEPTSGLDYTQMHMVGEILNRMKSESRTIITVTHDSEFIEHCCDEVIQLEEV